MNITEHDLESWLGSWADTAKDYAHKREHYIHPGDSLDPHREHLRYKLRLEGWPSALTFWYSVDVDTHRREWRHLSIQMSIYAADPTETVTQADINLHKRQLLEQFTPIVKLFFPLHEGVEAKCTAHEPRPVLNPETRQVTHRTPLSFHFLVRHDTTEHVILGGRRQAASGMGLLLDASGNEIRSPAPLQSIASDVTGTVTPASKPKEGKVIPFDEGAAPNRAARRRAERLAKKKDR